ncbi:hypothetical protein [Variovorax sp. UMC13]|uniref:hypothetical protein n=1 Tax=Variovorax sp. UMC13 TaxID=1862326 RepID=UPI0016007F4C|nr:hypothetical protein [Variovorax sp. UMC13]
MPPPFSDLAPLHSSRAPLTAFERRLRPAPSSNRGLLLDARRKQARDRQFALRCR